MDPLSIAGLMLAVFDQLWKIGNRIAELVSTYQEFHQVASCLYNSTFRAMTSRVIGFENTRKQE